MKELMRKSYESSSESKNLTERKIIVSENVSAMSDNDD
jgi:hypothetical protein